MFGGGLFFVVILCSKELEELCYERGFVYIIFYVLDFICVVVGVFILLILLEEKMVE